MRRIAWVVALLFLAACRTPMPPAAAPTGDAQSLDPTSVVTPVPAASLTSPLSATPTARMETMEGPITVEGAPLRGIAMGSGTVRYGVLAPGLARSEDGGRTWRHVSPLDLPLPLVASDGSQTLYSGAVPSCYRDDVAPPFRCSHDGGETWETFPAAAGIRPIATNPGDPATLYGISCWAMQVSHDGGATWEETGRTGGMDITSIIPAGSGRLLFLAVLTSEGGQSHLAWFDDEGKLAQDLSQGLNFWGLGVLATDGQILYLADSQGVRRSDDGGSHWVLFADGLEDVVLAADPLTEGVPEDAQQRGYGLLALCVDPDNPSRLALGSVRGLYLSNDRGEHWRPLAAERLGQSKITALAWEPDAPDTLWVTTTTGVYRVVVS